MKIIMKITMKYKAIFLILIFVSSYSYGQGFSKERSIKKSFSCKKSTMVQISNKYGDIVVENWDKDSVRFENHNSSNWKNL